MTTVKRLTAPIPNQADIDPLDLAWLAGLLEGEAHFGVSNTQSRRRPRISINMVDRDIIERVAAMWQSRVGIHAITVTNKVSYTTGVNGAPAVAWMKILYDKMSIRRRVQIDNAYSALAEYELGLRKSPVDHFSTLATIGETTLTIREWCDILKFTPNRILNRLQRGKSPEEAIISLMMASGRFDK